MSISQQTSLKIRPFTSADYDAITRIFNANFAPDFEKEPDELRHEDEHHADYVRWARWIVDIDGSPVAYGDYSQPMHIYNRRRFSLSIMVDPAHYGKGIGSRVYDVLLSEL